MRVATVASASVVLIAACAAPAQDMPAVLLEPGARARLELAQAVSSEFGGVKVPLADDALTRTPELVIERASARDAQGLLLNGRETGRPEIFRLVLAASQCVLVHERNGHRIALASATCGAR
jgi:hypothetical protein